MLKINSKVMTEWGEGILVEAKTDWNGLGVNYDNCRVVVWFGTNNPGTREGYSGQWITREMTLKELMETNKEKIRDERIDELLG